MNLETINEKEFFPGVFGRFVHGEKLSWAFWRVEKGAEVPLHHHVHEQMMHIVSGEFQFDLDGKSKTDSVRCHSHVPQGRATVEPVRQTIWIPCD
mgnify:CR=1 FL=1